MKKLIGLTGKTGSGKSSASKIFESLGAFVIDCDSIAHRALFEKEIIQKLKSFFPKEVFEGETVNRAALGKIVFSDKAKLKELNSIVHPWITSEVLKLAENSNADIVIIDGSELEASGIDEKCAHIIVVEAEESVRLKRIIARDNISREDALLRINAQVGYSKEAIILENNSTEKELRERIGKLYSRISE